MEDKCRFQMGQNAKMHFQSHREFKSLPEGSIAQIFLYSRGIKIPKSRGPRQGEGLVFK
jgi:hypothetical protein